MYNDLDNLLLLLLEQQLISGNPEEGYEITDTGLQVTMTHYSMPIALHIEETFISGPPAIGDKDPQVSPDVSRSVSDLS